jgi:hypothetical protein
MKTIYIKFRHHEDIYAIHPDYDLSPDNFIPPKICGQCGENLYIPVEFLESAVIVQPHSYVIRPLPKENPNLIIRSKPEPITIEFTPTNKLSWDEQQRLKRFYSVSYVDENGWAMLIDGYSKNPIKHECNV